MSQYRNQETAIQLLKSWSTWLVAIQAAVLGYLPLTASLGGQQGHRPTVNVAVLFFGLSIVFAAWVLGALPSIAQRMHAGDKSIFSYAIFDYGWAESRPWLRLGVFSFLQHLFFIAGIATLGVIVWKRWSCG